MSERNTMEDYMAEIDAGKPAMTIPNQDGLTMMIDQPNKETALPIVVDCRKLAMDICGSPLEEAGPVNLKLNQAADTIDELYAALQAVELARNSDEPDHWQRATDLTDAALLKAQEPTK